MALQISCYSEGHRPLPRAATRRWWGPAPARPSSHTSLPNREHDAARARVCVCVCVCVRVFARARCKCEQCEQQKRVKPAGRWAEWQARESTQQARKPFGGGGTVCGAQTLRGRTKHQMVHAMRCGDSQNRMLGFPLGLGFGDGGGGDGPPMMPVTQAPLAGRDCVTADLRWQHPVLSSVLRVHTAHPWVAAHAAQHDAATHHDNSTCYCCQREVEAVTMIAVNASRPLRTPQVELDDAQEARTPVRTGLNSPGVVSLVEAITLQLDPDPSLHAMQTGLSLVVAGHPAGGPKPLAVTASCASTTHTHAARVRSDILRYWLCCLADLMIKYSNTRTEPHAM